MNPLCAAKVIHDRSDERDFAFLIPALECELPAP